MHTMRKCLRATTALPVGMLTTHIGNKNCSTSLEAKDKWSVNKQSPLKIPKLALPAVQAMAAPSATAGNDVIRVATLNSMNMDVLIELTRLQLLTGLPGKIDTGLDNPAYPTLEYNDYFVVYDKARKNPLLAYEYVTADRLDPSPGPNPYLNAPAQWKQDCRLKVPDYDDRYDGRVNSRYARGKMVATENHAWRQIDQKHTWSVLNSSPMNAELRDGVWRKLENHTRDIARTLPGVRKGVHVFSGPVFKEYDSERKIEFENLGFIGCGRDKITIPTGFFKVLIIVLEDPISDRVKYDSLSFLVPNAVPVDSRPARYITDLATIKKVTGIPLGQPPNVPNRVKEYTEEDLTP